MPVYTATDVGRVRDINEDSICHKSFEKAELLAVADGMGGHSAGDVASSTALEKLQEGVTGAVESGRTDTQSVLAEGIERANDAVLSTTADRDPETNMGTTLVTAFVENGEAVFGNVGDSRAYRITTDRMEQITTDQSLVQELIEQGAISEDEARTHPQRHVLSQALGTDESVDPDFYQASVEDATLLLCSDGLPEELRDRVIHDVVTSASTLKEATEELIARANGNGGSDNISVCLYRS